jgi:hypothetical protein
MKEDEIVVTCRIHWETQKKTALDTLLRLWTTKFILIILRNLCRASIKTLLVSVNMAAFWSAAPCNLVDIDRRFRGVNCLHSEALKSHNVFPLHRSVADTAYWSFVCSGSRANQMHTHCGQNAELPIQMIHTGIVTIVLRLIKYKEIA